jgi:Sigma-54 interaction domain
MTIAPVLLDAKTAPGHIIQGLVARSLVRRVGRAGCLMGLVGGRAGLLLMPECPIQFFIHLELPGSKPSALILENIAALSAEEQARLLAWLGCHRTHTRVVSTTDRPLFAFVTRGDFDERLYYRLNVVLLQVGQSR